MSYLSFRTSLLIFISLLLLAAGNTAISHAQEDAPPRLQNPYVSPPFSPVDTSDDLPILPIPSKPESIVPLKLGRRPPRLSRASEAVQLRGMTTDMVQRSQGTATMPATLTNWEGIPHTNLLPPDTTGQVGPNHYVQMTNGIAGSTYSAQVRVWDKTGTQLYDFHLGDLWPAGDFCHDHVYGDPVVLYDAMADRWLLTQFAFRVINGKLTGPYYECMALSKSETPSNLPAAWNLYSFLVHNSKMNDYPKFGIWPDGYYMSANQFDSDEDWVGAGVWVFDRNAMLQGNSATFQYFDIADMSLDYSSLLPSNLMGSTLPPTNAPNYFLSVDMDWDAANDDVLHIFEFHTDWATPANSSFQWVKDLVVAPFNWDFDGSGNSRDNWDVPQPGTTTELDAISDRLMMHLWYRNFGDHEALVMNHTVNVGSSSDHAGVRWYEIRGGTVDATLADATLYQQSTFAPDATHRWMGSVAMDRLGNLAAGYSVSGNSVYPGIRYAGRLALDAPNMLTLAENTLVAGSGSQTHSAARWGDYSALSVDPADDCTFWYTTEYMVSTSLANWNTRIGSFKMPTCCGGAKSDVANFSSRQVGTAVVLSWQDVNAPSYEIYRAQDDPYFTPDASHLLGLSDTDVFTDTAAPLGDSSHNYFYKVLGDDICQPDGFYIERTGEFDFALVPGQ